MKLRQIIAAAFVVGTAFAASAQAGVLASADLAVSRLLIFDANGNVVTTGIAINSDTRTGNASADWNGVAATGVGPNNITSTTTGNDALTPPDVDVLKRCAGPSCPSVIGENDDSTHLVVPTGNFALGDMIVRGTAIGGGPAGQGASGLTRADASIMAASAVGGANSTIQNGVTAVTNFEATESQLLRFGLNYNSYLRVFIDGMAGETGAASATYSWKLTLRDVTANNVRILDWQPEQLNDGFTNAGPTSFTSGSNNINQMPIFSDLVNIISGHTYSLTINQASNVTASLIPEPGSVMLIGLGLAGLGASARRRRVR